MAKTRLSAAQFVERGYGQVEPNHLSAQLTGQIWAQLPAAATIDKLENGQFVKYNYPAGVCDFEGKGEWMLVFNEVKVYRDELSDQDFAMIRENYQARVYAPTNGFGKEAQSRYYSGRDSEGETFEKVTAPADSLELDATEDPFHFEQKPGFVEMPKGTTMVPRVFKTNVGDIMTTNCVNETELALKDVLVVGDDGYLTKSAGSNAGDMKWEVVKVYTLADRQKAVKIMRIA